MPFRGNLPTLLGGPRRAEEWRLGFYCRCHWLAIVIAAGWAAKDPSGVPRQQINYYYYYYYIPE
jgi:hypothetical protein